MAQSIFDVAASQPLVAPLLSDDGGDDGGDDGAGFIKATLDRRDSETVLAQLHAALQQLSAELGGQVSANLEPLLANVHATHGVEAKLLRSNERVEALTQAVRRIESQIARPYQQLGASIQQYERMLESAELLQQVQRAVTQIKRLRDAMDPPTRVAVPPAAQAADAPAGGSAGGSAAAAPARATAAGARRADLPKAAAALHELETILASVDLGGVDVVDCESA